MSAQPNTSRSYARLTPGDPAPWFHQRATSNPNYAFDTAAGRYVVLCFYASAGDAVGRTAVESVLANRSAKINSRDGRQLGLNRLLDEV